MKKSLAQLWQIMLITLVLFLFLAACSGGTPSQSGTAYPSEIKTEVAPVPQDQPTAAPPLTGPMAYPTASNTITPWDSLIDADLISDIHWMTYQGELEGSTEDVFWKISFAYPDDWNMAQNITPQHIYFQNIPEFQGPPPSTFAKFEVVRLNEPLTLTEGEIYIPSDFDTVIILGQPAVMFTRTDQPEQVQNFTISFQYEKTWIVAAGYIYLPEANDQELSRYRSILLKMATSIKIVK
jgi:hypothetical protein